MENLSGHLLEEDIDLVNKGVKIMDYKKELEQITETVETQKLEKAKLEERKRKLTEDKTKILKELEELGIKEEVLEETVEELEIELQKGIEKCKQVLN